MSTLIHCRKAAKIGLSVRPDKSTFVASRDTKAAIASILEIVSDDTAPWEVADHGTLLGVPVGMPQDPGLEGRVEATLEANVADPLRRLTAEVEAGGRRAVPSPATCGPG